MTNAVVASIERVMRYYRETLVLVSMHQTAKLTFKPLILAGALAAFSTCGLAEDTDLGKVAYESNCAACHGQSGKGNGPVSVELRTTPTDLTLIAKRNGGVFPADVLYRIIDGRKRLELTGHMKCRFGVLFFYALIPRTLLETASWQSSLTSGAYSSNSSEAPQ